VDKAPLAALKALLDKRAAGSLDFFLSSDGQSIRFGRNWVVSVSDALKNTKLMFVFLSQESTDSKWIHFEAGFAAALNVQVVPIFLPGTDLNRVTPPLSLLQGFNLNSHESMGNLARICNEVFELKLNESFCKEDFDGVFAAVEARQQGFFGKWAWAIEEIQLEIEAMYGEDETFQPLPKLFELCNSTGVEATADKTSDSIVHLPGCTIALSTGIKMFGKPQPTRKSVTNVRCRLSPELFDLTAPILDQWRNAAPFQEPCDVSIRFKGHLLAEDQSHKLTTKLYQTGIRLVSAHKFEFEGMNFSFHKSYNQVLEFKCAGKLLEAPIRRLLELLFENEVLWEAPMTEPIY